MAKRVPPTAAQKVRAKKAREEMDVEADRQQAQEVFECFDGIDEAVQCLTAVRESQGLSLRQLEETSGIPRGNLSRMENMKPLPRFATLQAYAKALGKNVKLVVTDE